MPIRGAYPVSYGGTPYVFADGRSCLRLAALAWYAALHREAIVHIPLCAPLPPMLASWLAPNLRASDVVFLHHSLAFRASGWRELRNRLGCGTPYTASIEKPGEWLYERFGAISSKPRSRDVLDFADHAETLFVVGSLPALGYVAAAFHRMSRAFALGDHAHLRGIARHGDSYKCSAGDDLIIEHYDQRLAHERDESLEVLGDVNSEAQ